MFKYLILLMTFSLAWSAGDGSHGSASDLLLPVINVSLLLGFFVYKLKKPLSSHFKNKAKSIKDSIERADAKSRQAQTRLEHQKNKNAKVESEAREIMNSAQAELQMFKRNYQEEISEKINKLQVDANNMVENEKKAELAKVGEELLNNVIIATKAKIKSDSSLKDKFNNNILREINQ